MGCASVFVDTRTLNIAIAAFWCFVLNCCLSIAISALICPFFTCFELNFVWS